MPVSDLIPGVTSILYSYSSYLNIFSKKLRLFAFLKITIKDFVLENIWFAFGKVIPVIDAKKNKIKKVQNTLRKLSIKIIHFIL